VDGHAWISRGENAGGGEPISLDHSAKGSDVYCPLIGFQILSLSSELSVLPAALALDIAVLDGAQREAAATVHRSRMEVSRWGDGEYPEDGERQESRGVAEMAAHLDRCEVDLLTATHLREELSIQADAARAWLGEPLGSSGPVVATGSSGPEGSNGANESKGKGDMKEMVGVALTIARSLDGAVAEIRGALEREERTRKKFAAKTRARTLSAVEQAVQEIPREPNLIRKGRRNAFLYSKALDGDAISEASETGVSSRRLSNTKLVDSRPKKRNSVRVLVSASLRGSFAREDIAGEADDGAALSERPTRRPSRRPSALSTHLELRQNQRRKSGRNHGLEKEIARMRSQIDGKRSSAHAQNDIDDAESGSDEHWVSDDSS
jgi:hypothetical protein